MLCLHRAPGRAVRRLGAAGFALAVSGGTLAAGLSVVGQWSQQIGPNDLASGPGSNFRSPIDSNATQATVNVSNASGVGWTVRVRLEDSTLPEGVSLAVRRSSDGSGDGSLSADIGYLVLNGQEQALFSGLGDRSAIGLQLRLSGVSISQLPGFHGCTLLYRIE
jgi:hypothetical protein